MGTLGGRNPTAESVKAAALSKWLLDALVSIDPNTTSDFINSSDVPTKSAPQVCQEHTALKNKTVASKFGAKTILAVLKYLLELCLLYDDAYFTSGKGGLPLFVEVRHWYGSWSYLTLPVMLQMGYKDVQGMKTIRDAAAVAMALVDQQDRAATQAAAVKLGRQAGFERNVSRKDRVPRSVLSSVAADELVMDDLDLAPPSETASTGSRLFSGDPLDEANDCKHVSFGCHSPLLILLDHACIVFRTSFERNLEAKAEERAARNEEMRAARERAAEELAMREKEYALRVLELEEAKRKREADDARLAASEARNQAMLELLASLVAKKPKHDDS